MPKILGLAKMHVEAVNLLHGSAINSAKNMGKSTHNENDLKVQL